MKRAVTRTLAGHLSETQLAQLVGLSIHGVRAWRKRGYGPPYVRIGQAVFYPQDDVADFIGSLPTERAGQ